MNLKQLIKKKIIEQPAPGFYGLTCQKCKKKWLIRNIMKLPKTCKFCKGDPYTGPGTMGRPKNA